MVEPAFHAVPDDLLDTMIRVYCLPRNKNVRFVGKQWGSACAPATKGIRFAPQFGNPLELPTNSLKAVHDAVHRFVNLEAVEIVTDTLGLPCEHIALGAEALRVMQAEGRADRLKELRIKAASSAVRATPNADDMASLIEAVAPFSGLVKLDIDSFDLGPVLAAVGGGEGTALERLTALSLFNCDLRSASAEFTVALGRMPALIALSLDDCEIGPSASLGVGSASTTLRALSLVDIDIGGPRSHLTDAVNALVPRLTSLEFSPYTLPGVALQAGTGITSLCLRENVDADEWDPEVGASIMDDVASLTRLTTLSLHDSHIDYAQLVAALGSLTGLTTLEVLWVSMSPAGAAALATPLGRLSRLRCLVMVSANLTPACVAVLAPAIRRLSRLTELHIDEGESIGSDGAAALVSALEAMPGLTCVSLACNNVGPAGLAAIAPSLAALKGLVDLDLSNNPELAGYGRSAALSAAVLPLTRLTRLYLQGVGLEDGQRSALRAELERAMPDLEELRV